jgi:hypothetical protein
MGCKEMEDYPYPEKGTGEGSQSSHSEGSDKCGCSANPCGGPFKAPDEIKLDPRAPNMTALLEVVAITVEERVRQLMNYYGLPIPESKENIQVDLSGPTPKVYTMGKMGWKEPEAGDPLAGAVIEQLAGLKPEDVERIEVISTKDGIPPEVLKRIEKIGMAMADKLGKDRFDIVTIVEDGKGNVATKRTEYIKSNPVRPELKKDKPYLVKKESFQQKLERKRTLHKPEAAKKLEAPKKVKRGNLNFRELDPVENRRVYIFPGNHRVIVENACRLAITDSGVHRLETTTGEKHIIPAGWLQIKINAPAWSF